MKRCPQCNLNYEDETLEFCLEDGNRLVLLNSFDAEIPTIARATAPNPTAEKTVSFPSPTQKNFTDLPGANKVQTLPKTAVIKEKAVEQTNKILAAAPLVLALAHNWWQWIYLNNQTYSNFTSYFFSSNFLIWILLLIAGAIFGLIGLKRVKNKSFSIAGLVILAINFILFMVPKR